MDNILLQEKSTNIIHRNSLPQYSVIIKREQENVYCKSAAIVFNHASIVNT